MKKEYGQQAIALANALIAMRGVDTKFMARDWWAVAKKEDPTIKLNYVQNFNYNKLVKTKKVNKVFVKGQRGSLFEMLFEADQVHQILGTDKFKPKAASYREMTKGRDPNEIDAITFGERMFIWMNHIRNKANTADADMQDLKDNHKKDIKIIRGLQDELDKAQGKLKNLEADMKGKVAWGKYKDLLDQNDRLKTRLDEQNRQMQELNRRTGSRFNIKDMARFKTGQQSAAKD